jgi:hypothetical protein
MLQNGLFVANANGTLKCAGFLAVKLRSRAARSEEFFSTFLTDYGVLCSC